MCRTGLPFCETFDFYLQPFLKSRNPETVYKNTWLSKSEQGGYRMNKKTFSKIRSKKDKHYRPERKNAILLAFGMRLSAEQAQNLFASAGHVLLEDEGGDRVVLDCFRQRNFDIVQLERKYYEQTGAFLSYQE